MLLEGLTREKLAATPFDEASLADFEAELSTYTPLPPAQPDTGDANNASIRAESALTTFYISWACAGPFSSKTRQSWENYATALSTDSDVLVRKECALALWVMTQFPEASKLSPAGAESLDRLRLDAFIRDQWESNILKILKPRVERAGRTWPSGL